MAKDKLTAEQVEKTLKDFIAKALDHGPQEFALGTPESKALIQLVYEVYPDKTKKN